jgi:hypothetical protein
METRPGLTDPISQCELALEIGMTVGEINHGRGTPMSAHELTVVWPLFYAYQARERARQQAEADKQRGSLR